MKVLVITVFTLLTLSTSAQVIDTIGPKSKQPVWRGPANKNTDPIVPPTYTDTVHRQQPGSSIPPPPKIITPPTPNQNPNYNQPYNPTAPSVPPTQTNPTSPATPNIGRSNGTPPGLMQ